MRFIRKGGRIIPIKDNGPNHVIINRIAKEHGVSTKDVRRIASVRGILLNKKLDSDQQGELEGKSHKAFSGNGVFNNRIEKLLSRSRRSGVK